MPDTKHPESLDTLASRRRQAAHARRALAEQRLSTPEARRAYFSAMGRASSARRRVLSGDDVEALAGAYRTLDRIVKKYRVLEATDAQRTAGAS